MEVKGLVIQSLSMGDASHLTGGAISLEVFTFFRSFVHPSTYFFDRWYHSILPFSAIIC